MKRYFFIALMTIVTLVSSASVYNYLNIVKADGTGNSFAATGTKVTFSGNTASVTTEGKTATLSLGTSGYLEFSNTNLGSPSGIKGDINGDGVVDVIDVNCIINVILGNVDASQYGDKVYVNEDNEIDILDVNALISLIIKS